MHKKLHVNEEHVCGICGFSCGLKKILDRHMVVHDEEKHFQCAECHYSCRRLMDIRKHVVSMHTGRPRRKRSEEACCSLLSEMRVPFEREVVIRFQFPSAPHKFARVDIFWQTGFGAILFEVDEYAHKGPRYCIDYECQRMSLIFEALSKKFSRIHIIRYNPHPVRGLRKPTDEERKEQIRLALSLDPQRPLTISYLFYHMRDGFPEISLSPLYTLREHIRLPDQ
jgi:hypothetical protein